MVYSLASGITWAILHSAYAFTLSIRNVRWIVSEIRAVGRPEEASIAMQALRDNTMSNYMASKKTLEINYANPVIQVIVVHLAHHFRWQELLECSGCRSGL